uniref:Uncharacterized protein n=1 Tax=Arundo donax TaxID=35708 RepID=A0A0A9GS36_ARUDO
MPHCHHFYSTKRLTPVTRHAKHLILTEKKYIVQVTTSALSMHTKHAPLIIINTPKRLNAVNVVLCPRECNSVADALAEYGST